MKKVLIPLLLLVVVSCNYEGSSGAPSHDEEYVDYLIEKENELAERERQLEERSQPETIRENLGDIERRNPKSYLSLDYEIGYKILANDDVVKGRIYNNASVTQFKDVQIAVKCYSKTNTLLETYSYTVYEFVDPQNSVPYQIRFKSPRGTRTISAEIVGAVF